MNAPEARGPASDVPLIMGVVNVTPDSFSDGGRLATTHDAIAYGLRLVREGADIVDVGGEATNPRAAAVSADVELARAIPVVDALVRAGATVSIDTTKAVVARAAIAAGATIVNDISGGRFDPEMGAVVDNPRVTYVVGHLRGDTLAAVFASEGTIAWQDVAGEPRCAARRNCQKQFALEPGSILALASARAATRRATSTSSDTSPTCR